MPLFPNYIRACPYFETQFYQNRVMPDQTKTKECMELEFRKIKFQNATIGLKNITIKPRLKNAAGPFIFKPRF